MLKDVTAVITAMTDAEKNFLNEAIQAALSDEFIGQIIVCVEEKNQWIDSLVQGIKDDRLEIHRLPMMNVSKVRNYGVKKSRLDWVAFCDGDDVWCKDKTRYQRVFVSKLNASFIGADHLLINTRGEIKACGLARYIPMPSSWLIRTEVMRKYPFDENVHQGQDCEWWFRTRKVIKKARCPHQLILYRVRASSLSDAQPSKKRKARVVKISENSVFGSFFYFLTYLLWLMSRRYSYRWHSAWIKP
ncbi:MAG: hypothetical protein ACLFUB_13930 [Cyclobacteriaceae bacterium]